MTILLMRHGETQWNVIGRKQGRGNSALTDHGRDQALRCGKAIADSSCEINKIFVSPLGRAQETCKIISEVINVQSQYCFTVNELAELDYGLWQGLTEQDIDLKFPGQLAVRRLQHWTYRIPEGESYSMVNSRIRKWWHEQELHGSLIIAHEMVNRVILGAYQCLRTESTLALSHSHDQIYRLRNGSVDSIFCAQDRSA